MSMPSLPWPKGPVIPIEPLRPVLDRLTSLSMLHPQDVTAIPGLATVDGEVQADPPPALEQIVDEFGGILVRGGSELVLLISERSSDGPYTMLGDSTTYYPLHEDTETESAVILTVDEHGEPGAVYGIGDDLALRLAAPDLDTYLHSYADAVEATISELDEIAGPDATEAERDHAARALMRHHLFDAITGTGEDPAGDDAAGDDAAGPGEAEQTEPSARVAAPQGAVAVWDLRQAPLGITVPVIDAEIPGDPLEHALAWAEGGLVLALVPRG